MPQMMIAENLSINPFKIKKDNTLNELSKNKISQNYQPSAPTTVNNIFYDASTCNNTNLESHLKKSVFKFAPPAIINQFDLAHANKNTKLTSRNHAQLQVHKFIPPMQHLQRASTTATQNTCLNNANNENKAKPNSNNVQMNESNKFKTKIYQNQFQLKNSKMSAPSIQQQQQQQQQPNYNKSQNIVNPSYRSQIPIPLPAKSVKPQPQTTTHYANYVNYERAFNSKTNLPLIDMIIKNTEANRLNALYSANHCGYNITKSTNNLNSHPATPTTNNTGYSSNTLNSTHSNTSTSTKSSASHKTNLKKTASTPQLEKEPTPTPAPPAPPVESNLPVLIPLPMPFLPNYSMTMPKQIALPAYDNQYSQFKNMSSTLSKLDTAKAGADALLPLVVKLEPLTSTPITSTPKIAEQTEQPAKSEEKKPPQANEKKQETASSSSLSKQAAKVIKIDQSSPPLPKLKLSLIPSHSSCSLKAVLPRKSSADNLDEPEHVIDLNIDFSKKNKPVITANKLPTSAQVTTQVVNLSKQPSQSDIYDKHANHELKEADLKLKSFSLHSIEKKPQQQSNLKKSSMPPLPTPKVEKQEKTNRLLLSSDLKKPQLAIAPAKSVDKLTQTPNSKMAPSKPEPQVDQSPSYFNNLNKTANIDSLINSLLKQVEKTKLEQQQQQQSQALVKKETPILDAITSFSADFVTEYKTCINVGNEFTSNDITVQLVDDQNNAKKLYVHCYRLEPVSARSVTLSTGQLPSKMDVSYANTNGHNYLRKELKKEILIPSNADINTMESYLENGSLVIKCLLNQNNAESNLPAHLQTALNKLPSNVNAELSKLSQQKGANVSQRQKSSIISEFELNNGLKPGEFSLSQSPDIELEYATGEHDYLRSHYNANQQYCQAARHSKHESSCIFENPLYNSSKLDAESASSKPILKANSLNLLEQDEVMYAAEKEYVAKKAARAKQNDEDLLMSYLKREEAAKKTSKKSGSGKKRRYKSNDCLLDDYSLIEKSSHRRTSLANLDSLDKTVYRPRPQSASSVGSGNNAVTKSVRFDMSNKTIQIKENEDKSPKRNRNSRHHRHRSSRSVDHTLNGGKRTSSSNSIINSSQTNNLNQINRLSGDLIQDGYNCITKDGLDNIFLTYFFKLPSCSPADRTQARIEHHNILKLKIIQEKSFSTQSKSKKKTSKHSASSSSSSRSKAQKPSRNHKSEQDSAAMHSSGSTSSSVKSLLSQSPTLSSSSSSTSPFSNSTSLSLSSLSTSVESDDSLTCFNDETSKIMLREFSRQCRLPDHLFKFDETGVTVSFVNNVWVRVEIPIVDFLEPIIDLKSSNGKKKQINNEKQYDINSSSSNNFSSKQKVNNNNNTAFLTNYQTESDSVDFKPSGKSAKNILNYFEDKNDADVQI